MDNRVRVRFFRPARLRPDTPPLSTAMFRAFEAATSVRDREIEIHTGVTVRLERLRRDGDITDIEVVRVQTGNLPPEATHEGLVPLAVGGLGHSAVISYHELLDVIAVQSNHNMSVGRAFGYLKRVDPAFDYRADALVRRDAWERYNRGRPRKLRLAIAAPENLPAIEGEVGALTDMSRNLAEMAGAPLVTIEVSMGSHGGGLTKDFVDRVLNVFTNGAAREHDIRDLTVTTANDDGPGSAPIDFLDDVLTDDTVLDLPREDTEAHFERRRAYVRHCLRERQEYIAEVYRPTAI